MQYPAKRVSFVFTLSLVLSLTGIAQSQTKAYTCSNVTYFTVNRSGAGGPTPAAINDSDTIVGSFLYQFTMGFVRLSNGNLKPYSVPGAQ